MFRYLFLAAGLSVALPLLGASTVAAAPTATCIAARCAAIGGGVAAPGVPPVFAQKNIAAVVHPAVGVYCLLPLGLPPKLPYVPVVSVADDLTVGLPVAGFGVSFAEVDFAAAKCPARNPNYVEIDTFAPAGAKVAIGVGGPFVAEAPVPSDSVGFTTQF